jgi:hypothetical protein
MREKPDFQVGTERRRATHVYGPRRGHAGDAAEGSPAVVRNGAAAPTVSRSISGYMPAPKWCLSPITRSEQVGNRPGKGRSKWLTGACTDTGGYCGWPENPPIRRDLIRGVSFLGSPHPRQPGSTANKHSVRHGQRPVAQRLACDPGICRLGDCPLRVVSGRLPPLVASPAQIPGPFWASVTRFYIVKYNLFSERSQFYLQVEKLHQQYGMEKLP